MPLSSKDKFTLIKYVKLLRFEYDGVVFFANYLDGSDLLIELDSKERSGCY